MTLIVAPLAKALSTSHGFLPAKNLRRHGLAAADGGDRTRNGSAAAIPAPFGALPRLEDDRPASGLHPWDRTVPAADGAVSVDQLVSACSVVALPGTHDPVQTMRRTLVMIWIND